MHQKINNPAEQRPIDQLDEFSSSRVRNYERYAAKRKRGRIIYIGVAIFALALFADSVRVSPLLHSDPSSSDDTTQITPQQPASTSANVIEPAR